MRVGQVHQLRHLLRWSLLRLCFCLTGSFGSRLAQRGLAFPLIANERLIALSDLFEVARRFDYAEATDGVIFLGVLGTGLIGKHDAVVDLAAIHLAVSVDGQQQQCEAQ